MELLFSYGTLQLDSVQLETFGRLLTGEPDSLPGYVVGEIEILDEAVVAASGKRFHPILRHTGQSRDTVAGTVYEITPEELAHADRYEVEAYARNSARLQSGRMAWIYAAAQASS